MAVKIYIHIWENLIPTRFSQNNVLPVDICVCVFGVCGGGVRFYIG